MAAIRILPDLLANKIAAGEVVERPASVVKELVENALDAGGDRILIEIEDGGRTLIQVADNGSGMGQDDALLSLERFATSKLYDEAGLSAIETLGFRGEALPSVAAVSKMVLATRRAHDSTGVQVTVHGGKIISVQETGAPPGTMVSVNQLFFNTPARRKFMKSVATEMNHIADMVAGLALGYPQVHFGLTHNHKLVYQWPCTIEPIQRTAQVLGQTAAPDLFELDSRQESITIRGYLAPPRLARATSRGCYIFVNGRRVHDRVILHALLEGYRGRLIKGRFPVAVLDIRLPFDQVDVNVHPTKHEVRFAHANAVHMSVQRAVSTVLERFERRLWANDPAIPAGDMHRHSPVSRAAESVPSYGLHPLPKIGFEKVAPFSDKTQPSASMSEPVALEPLPGSAGALSSAESQTPRFSDLKVIGQFNGLYILCQAPEALIIIDQHAAHERIVYEALQNNAGRLPSQRLLLPVTVDLGFAAAQALQELSPNLIELGMEIEPFGGNTFAVRAVPAILIAENIESLIVELAENRVELGPHAGLAGILEQSRMIMACHRSIRANQNLLPAEIKALLTKLDECREPSHCPHGRPTWTRWTLRDLAKCFGRT